MEPAQQHEIPQVGQASAGTTTRCGGRRCTDARGIAGTGRCGRGDAALASWPRTAFVGACRARSACRPRRRSRSGAGRRRPDAVPSVARAPDHPRSRRWARPALRAARPDRRRAGSRPTRGGRRWHGRDRGPRRVDPNRVARAHRRDEPPAAPALVHRSGRQGCRGPSRPIGRGLARPPLPHPPLAGPRVRTACRRPCTRCAATGRARPRPPPPCFAGAPGRPDGARTRTSAPPPTR